VCVICCFQLVTIQIINYRLVDDVVVGSSAEEEMLSVCRAVDCGRCTRRRNRPLSEAVTLTLLTPPDHSSLHLLALLRAGPFDHWLAS